MHRLFFLCFIPYLMVILMNGADTALLIRKFNMEMILPVITAAQIPDDYELETIKAQTIIARSNLIRQIQESKAPVSGTKLASLYSVSRQVIVQDLAVIRASMPGILSTTKGYVLQQDSSCSREFKVRHSQDKAAEELNLIVDCGGHVKNISISHRVYGRVSAEMDIRSRQDVNEFAEALRNSRSTVLSSATSGYHYHLIEASSEERLDLIEKQLGEAGFLAPLQPWEQTTGKGKIKL